MNAATASNHVQLILAAMQILGLVVTVIVVVVTTRANLQGFQQALATLTRVVDHLRETVEGLRTQVAVLEATACSPNRCENYRPVGGTHQTTAQ